MKSLEARVAALEHLRPAPNIIFVARYRPDGTIVPLQKGTQYGARVALIPERCASSAEWLERYTQATWANLDAVQKKAVSKLVAFVGHRGDAEKQFQ